MESLTAFLQEALRSGEIGYLALALGAAYVGGLLSSLTPCVYPMIPITVSVMAGSGQRSWKDLAARSAVYLAGMTVIYSFLGVIAGMTGKVFGTFTNTHGWYVGLGFVIALAALVMLDVIPFDPMTWFERLKRKIGSSRKTLSPSAVIEAERQLSWLGIFGMGATSGLVGAPCTTPVLTAVLAFIAQTQSVGLGFVLMVFFSLGLGTLLIIVGLFAGAIRMLPRSGNWMKTVKLASGLLLLGFSYYLFYRAGTVGGM